MEISRRVFLKFMALLIGVVISLLKSFTWLNDQVGYTADHDYPLAFDGVSAHFDGGWWFGAESILPPWPTGTPSNTPSPTKSQTPTPTREVRPSLTPVNTRTPKPTMTPSQTATKTSTSTITPETIKNYLPIVNRGTNGSK